MKALDDIIKFACFTSKLLSANAEVVVHDVKRGRIIWIENGGLTNRKVGDRDEVSSIKLLYEASKKNGSSEMIVGYHSKTASNYPLRSSNLFFEDENGALNFAICVNENMAPLEAMREYCNNFLHADAIEKLADVLEDSEDTIETLTMNVLFNEIEKAKPYSLDSREAKLTILKRLNEKGVFEVRHASEKVCDLLHIATPTLYKYLKEIKGGK